MSKQISFVECPRSMKKGEGGLGRVQSQVERSEPEGNLDGFLPSPYKAV